MNFLKELSIFDRVTFVEKTHSYLIDGQPSNSISVTRLLKKYKKEFDKIKAATKVAKRTNTTIQQVLADWDMNNLYSTTIGSMLHKYVENFYANKRIEFDGDFSRLGYDEKKKISVTLPVLIKYFQNFYNDNRHCICVKSELVLGDIDDTKVCGMSDMLCYNTITDQFEIFDFKTNKKMDKETPWGKLSYPFDEFSEGEINEYTIQLNCYKYFIEKYTNIAIDKLKIVWINANNADYQQIELADIQDKIALMFDQVKSSSLFEGTSI
jgi:hypothetical protein